MLNALVGNRMAFYGSVLDVPDAQRKEVEAVMQQCHCSGTWSRHPTISAVVPYDDKDEKMMAGPDAVWTLVLPSEEDAKTVQAALDKIA